MNEHLHINEGRLLARLAEMAKIGATEKGGVCRVALSDEDKAGRDLFIEWCQAAGCNITVDQIGNIFATRKGSDDDLPVILAGSHLDSQPTGGKFDGVYGVLAALEVVETLNDHKLTTTHPLEIVSWTNEEGARFPLSLTGSGVYTGIFDLEYALSREDKDGVTIGRALQQIGYDGEHINRRRPIKAAFEIHIEQGPVLEADDVTIGVVNGIQGICWEDLIFEGQEAHAGTIPMDGRRDPVRAAARVVEKIYLLVDQYAPDARVTFGDFSVEPASRNTVPSLLTVTLDYRHPQASVLDKIHQGVKEIMESECSVAGIEGRVERVLEMPPVNFDPVCINAVQDSTDKLGYSSMQMISGAGHDAMYLAGIAPTGMIFIPCENGLSHNELENAQPEDLIAGGNVLLHAILELANP